MPNGDAFVSKHWHVIIYLVGLVFLGGMTYANNGAQDTKIAENKEHIEAEDAKIEELAREVTELASEQKHQGENIDEIKQDVKEILRELRTR